MIRHISEAWFLRHGPLTARVTPHGKLVLTHASVSLGRMPYHIAHELAHCSTIYLDAVGHRIGLDLPGTWVTKAGPDEGLVLIRPQSNAVPRATAAVCFESHCFGSDTYFATCLVAKDLRDLPAVAPHKRG